MTPADKLRRKIIQQLNEYHTAGVRVDIFADAILALPEIKRTLAHHDKTVLLSVGDGPDGIEIFTSEDKAVVDWAHDIPALYINISCGMTSAAQFGPFSLSKSLIAQLKERLK